MFFRIGSLEKCKCCGQMTDVTRYFETATKKEMIISGFLSVESMEISLNKEKRERFVAAVFEYAEHKNTLMHMDSQHYYKTLAKENAIKRLRDFIWWCKTETPNLQAICEIFLNPDLKKYCSTLLPGNDEVQKKFLYDLTEFAKHEAQKSKTNLAA